MKIIENSETNEFYIWKRNGKHSKLELVRRNYVFCRNEKNMLLSPTEHPEVNSFCEVKRSLMFCPMICPDMDHPVYTDVGDQNFDSSIISSPTPMQPTMEEATCNFQTVHKKMAWFKILYGHKKNSIIFTILHRKNGLENE